ncbi:MAG: hypothetical protein ACO4CP_08890 [Steroidobacteraceae bacterium]
MASPPATIDVRRLLESVTHFASSLDALDYERIRDDVRRHSLARISGALDRETVRACLSRIRSTFDAGQDRKHDPRDTEAVRRNFQKLQIGANSGADTRRTLGRFLRILYNPIFAEDVFGLRESFAITARFRNRLYGLPEDFAVEGTDNGFFTCSRIQQYPQGGGFMVPHRDIFSRLATEKSDLGYFQVFFLLTEKGRDYHEGGGYVEIDKQRVHFEDHTASGDIVIYDGRSVHGVADVDPLLPLNLGTFGGRSAGFVSLFRHLASDGDSYAKLSREAVERLMPGDGH